MSRHRHFFFLIVSLSSALLYVVSDLISMSQNMVMISIFCPFCHMQVHITVAQVTQRNQFGQPEDEYETCQNYGRIRGSGLWWVLGVCPSCNERILIKTDESSNVISVFPTPQPKKLDPELPSKFVSDLSEANICFSIGAFRATTMLCRRIMAAIQKDKSCSNLNEMKDKGIITPEYLKLAYASKLIGDSSTHDDLIQGTPLGKEDAEAALEFTHAIIDMLYIQPIRVDKTIQKYKSKK